MVYMFVNRASVRLFLITVLSLIIHPIHAQEPKELVNIVITPDHSDWLYDIGEKASFRVMVLKNDIPLEIGVSYIIRPEKMGILEEGKLQLDGGSGIIKAPPFKNPGFLRCQIEVNLDGKLYSDYTTIGYEVSNIKPTTSLPDDFMEFWNGWKEQLAEIPIDPVLRHLPDRCTDKVNVFEVQMNNIHGKIYGILSVPKKIGKYPAILIVPGAGVRPYKGYIDNAALGFITLQIGIHGIPVTLEKQVYDDLRLGALKNYYHSNLDDRDEYYYKRVYLGCVRAVDFIFDLEAFDGSNLAVTGGSQGGALSIVTAGLDTRVSCLAPLYPALSDLTGYLNDRAGGWPHMFQEEKTQTDIHIENSKYYDVVNFARFIKAPGWYSWGFNDPTCPPTSMYAAYNVITAKKELHIYQNAEHWSYPEQQERRLNWIYNTLKKH